MLKTIEAIDASSLVTVAGRSFPAVALLEDEEGRRWLLNDSLEHITPPAWIKAHSGGASGIVVPTSSGFRYMTTEHFMQYRTESMGLYLLSNCAWYDSTNFPSLRSLAVKQAAPISAGDGFVHLHLHTEYSSWDGHSKMSEVVAAVSGHGQFAFAASDHGTVAGQPEQAALAKKAGLKPLFAMESYFVDDRFSRDTETEDYTHLLLVAKNNAGLQNLWGASTEAYRDGFYRKPRLDWDTLGRHRDGMIASTGCLGGPLASALLKEDDALARTRLARLLDIFGDDLYVEIHTNGIPEQRRINEALVAMAREVGVPLLGVVDSHFPTQEQAPEHKAWMACATGSEVDDEAEIFGFNADSWILSEEEARAALSYLPQDVVDECVANTALIANQCDAALSTSSDPPKFSKPSKENPDPVRADEDRLWDMCMDSWEKKTTSKRESQDVYMARFEREMRLLIDKGFCGYFLMVADYCRAAKDGRVDGHADGKLTGKPILVGPGRGSGGGSLVAYLSGITGVDPVDADLLFERFLTEGRTALPDFDVDFPASKKKHLLSYVKERWGEEYVATVGSHLRLKNKGIVKNLSKAMASELPETAFMDLQGVSTIITEAEAGTAGLGLSWEELWAQEGDRLDPYRERYPALFAMADKLVGRLHTYGKHAAGVVISTDFPLTGALPLRRATDDDLDKGLLVTQFEKDALESLGLTKFDLLTIRTLDTIQMALDLIEEQRGVRINVEEWRDEYEDPQVWQEISDAHTLGIFQIETVSGTRLTKRMKPDSVAQLADMITLVRPGPMRSGLTETYLRRKDGQEAVTFPDPRMETVLAKTFGCLLYQEDIMAACMVLAGYDSVQADEVRSILGKKKVEKIPEAGEKFIAGCVERGMDQMAAAGLWAQMAEFAKYSFNRAHAFAYAIIGYWCAWLKFHYPSQFLTAALSTVDKDRIPDFVAEARRMGYSVLPPDINESRRDFTSTALAVRYGLASLKGIDKAADYIVAGQPYASFEDFIEGCVKMSDGKVNMGHVATLARIGAFDSMVPNRRALEAKLLADKDGTSTRCQSKDTTIPVEIRPIRPVTDEERSKEGFVAPEPLPCVFDWAGVPLVLGRTGKPLKNQSKALPPKRCTKSCHKYVSVPELDFDEVTPYTERDIRNIEHEMLGVYLSSTPFDELDPETREVCFECAEIIPTGPQAVYYLAGIVSKVKPWTDRNGNKMAFIAIDTEAGTHDISVLSTEWDLHQQSITPAALVIAEVKKNSRGLNLITMSPVL